MAVGYWKPCQTSVMELKAINYFQTKNYIQEQSSEGVL